MTDYIQPFSDVVTAVELLNEPMGPKLDMNQVKQFYQDGYWKVRPSNSETVVVIHDAFQDLNYWSGFLNEAMHASSVMLDTHLYQVFSPGENAMTPSDHIAKACTFKNKLKSTDKWTIVGEWSGAQTDCAKWLNGLGTGARYDGTFALNGGSYYIGNCDKKYTGTVDGMLADDKKNLQAYVAAQLDAYESHSGWIFWCWKTESAPEWNFRDLFKAGLIPNPLSSRTTGIC